ncbi:MAG: hypothetical protein K2R98_10935 [Gemmataceae bacterium]|nr:hypothetical protein [Gemmataceae bacterium]
MRFLMPAVVIVTFGTMSALAQNAEPLMQFDGNRAEVRLMDGRWYLLASGVRIKDLGSSETDARQVLDAIRTLRLNQLGTIGQPQPIMEYWLSSGRAPTGMVPGMRQIAFNPQQLQAVAIQGRWCLRDDRDILLSFGTAGELAKHSLEIIRRYGFNRLAYIGETAPVMMVFLNSPDQLPHLPTPQPQNTLFGTSLPATAPMPGSADLTSLRTLNSLGSLAPAQLPTAATLEQRYSFQRPEQDDGQSVPVDWQRVDLVLGDQGWKLISKGRCLASFGSNEQAARDARALVQYYRATEFCRIGKGGTGLAYLLANGEAPRGQMLGARSITFRPEALNVQQSGGGWVICDAGQPLFLCGTSFEEASQTLELIQRYQFDRVCRVGNMEPAALTLLLRGN